MCNFINAPNMKNPVIVFFLVLDIIHHLVHANNSGTTGSKTENPKSSVYLFFKTLGDLNQHNQSLFAPLNFTQPMTQANPATSLFYKQQQHFLQGNPFAQTSNKNFFSIPNNGSGVYQPGTIGFTIPSLLQISDPGGVSSGNSSDEFEDLGPNCELSVTTVNQKRVCRGTIIFKDEFTEFDDSKWLKEQFIPSYSSSDDDMIFNYFDINNTEVIDNRLAITPKIIEEKIIRGGHLKLDPCTGTIPEECEKKSQFQWILPPVSSGRVSTKNAFSFKYGYVEITAKVPKGDWLIPELWLLPKTPKYGPGLESGKMVMIMTRGNRELESDGTDLGFRVLESSLLMSSHGKIKSRTLRIKSEEPWHFHYNKYLFSWKPDEITVSVNGIIIGNLMFKNLTGSLANLAGFSHEEEKKWLKGSAMAPFDQEFYISLGLSVGGRDFPDGSVSGNYIKPWKSRTVKEMLDFWKAKDKWAPTWNENYPKLKILRIKVKSL